MKETSFGYEQALEKIKGIGQKPIAIEIQWDGDTQGWFIMLFLITETGCWRFKRIHVHHLGNISSVKGDLRLFNGQVPPWPEAVRAKDIAEQLKKELNWKFTSLHQMNRMMTARDGGNKIKPSIVQIATS